MLPASRRGSEPPVSQRRTPRQMRAVALGEHDPERRPRNPDLLGMDQGRLRDFASTRGLGRFEPTRELVRGNTGHTLVRATGIGLQRNKLV